MEQNDEQVNSIISNNIPKAIMDHPPSPPPSQPSLRKKHGTKNIFKVALFMMRGRHRQKSKLLPMDDGSRSIWRKLVGSMRPLHLQDNKSPLRTPPRHPNGMITTSTYENTTAIQSEVDGFDSASEFPNSPSPASSRYASAVGLNEMVEDEEEEINVMVEDEMVDAKAEEFIARFYREMKLQRLDITDRRYKEISMRSLGL